MDNVSSRTSIAIVQSKGQITISAAILEAAQLEEGDPVDVELVADGILLRPSVSERHESGEDFLAALRAEVHDQ